MTITIGLWYDLKAHLLFFPTKLTKEMLPELHRRNAGLLLEKPAEIGGFLKPEIVRHFLGRLVGIDQQPFGFTDDPVMDDLQRGRLLDAGQNN
jgi:hypothetical protein